ncbi:Uncharacterized protein TCM_036977 [Theobroma cacao]|uniref:Uncharacterized protein n=1 Tax=Theobroma cacao TaxID=3641 RepID=A0A061GHU3_THECC|nr:Uncharacterized protein TCM_036977 [Theobroma cacao]
MDMPQTSVIFMIYLSRALDTPRQLLHCHELISLFQADERGHIVLCCIDDVLYLTVIRPGYMISSPNQLIQHSRIDS